MRMRLLFISLAFLAINIADGLKLESPPMGWSTWESFAKRVNESVILEHLGVLEMTGLRDKGYTIIQIDDGWQKMNRANGWISRGGYDTIPNNSLGPGNRPGFVPGSPPGCITPDPSKFPRGMSWLGQEVQRRGFKYGLYTSGEHFVCDSNRSFRGFYSSSSYANLRGIDAQCFNEWRVDLLKIDNCNPPTQSEVYAQSVLSAWRRLLDPRIIIYNSRYGCLAKTFCGRRSGIYRCPFDVDFKRNGQVQGYCAATSDLARLGMDMKPNWRSLVSGIVARIGRGAVSRPGFWSDPDYLLPHATEITFVQARTQFSAWCITSSPLFVSVDMRRSTPQTLQMLGNTDAIRVNQQYFNQGGDLWRMNGVMWSFTKRLGPSEMALLVLHVGAALAPRRITYRDQSLAPKTDNPVTFSFRNSLSRFATQPGAQPTKCRFKNIWTGEVGFLYRNSTFPIALHDCVFLLLSDCA